MSVLFNRRPFFFAPRLLSLAVLGSLVLTGCAVTPKPLTQEELVATNKADKDASRRDMPAITAPVSLEEAVARALKYNLDHRTRMMEQALAAGQLDASRYDMLPRLLLDAGYAWRDQDNTRLSLDPVTGNISQIGYISSSRTHTTVDLGLHWNILDFGIGYYNAKENADRLLISVERRRRAMHALIQNVRTAFWRAAAAEKLSDRVRATIQEAESALSDSRRIADEKIKSPRDALRYQRNLLENLRLLENVDRELGAARIELASLIGAVPGSRIPLVEPREQGMPLMDIPIERMEEFALTQNADLREQHYNARIAAIETRRALLKLIPNLSFSYIHRYDDDKYLIENQWNDAGFRVSYNLLSLFAAPSRKKVAEIGVTLAENKRMALQMSVLTQVHLARHQYEDALRQYSRSDAIYDVDNRLAVIAQSQEQSQMASQLDRISANVTTILSEVRRYQAMAKVHEAASRVQASLGMEPKIGNLDEIDLPTLQQQIGISLLGWAKLELPAVGNTAVAAVETTPVAVALVKADLVNLAPVKVAPVEIAKAEPPKAETGETVERVESLNPAAAAPVAAAEVVAVKTGKRVRATSAPAFRSLRVASKSKP